MNRKPRGKAKPVPIEAKRLAASVERLRRLEANPPSHEQNREVTRWARQWIDDRVSKADAEIFDGLVRQLRRRESKAERVIRARWPYWNVERLQWEERQLKMKDLGFPEFSEIPSTTFKSLCTRKLGLKYRRSDPEAEHALRAHWPLWNTEGLQWGQRMLRMTELGFDDFKRMPPTSFKSLCKRMRLQYALAK